MCGAGTIGILNIAEDGTLVENRFVRRVPLDDYSYTVSLHKDGRIGGIVSGEGFVPSGSRVYVYAPDLEGFDGSEDMDAEAENIKGLFAQCIGAAVTSSEYTGGACSWQAA